MKKFEIKTIKENYFKDNRLKEVLYNKSETRPYLYVMFKYKDNNLFIPFRSELNKTGNLDKIINTISYDIGYNQKPNAKLDFSKMLIINDLSYVTDEQVIIDSKQYRIIKRNIEEINNNINKYIAGYVKAYNKNRVHIDNKYKYSTLVNYHRELEI